MLFLSVAIPFLNKNSQLHGKQYTIYSRTQKFGYILTLSENRAVFSNLLTKDHIDAIMTNSTSLFLMYSFKSFNSYYKAHIH